MKRAFPDIAGNLSVIHARYGHIRLPLSDHSKWHEDLKGTATCKFMGRNVCRVVFRVARSVEAPRNGELVAPPWPLPRMVYGGAEARVVGGGSRDRITCRCMHVGRSLGAGIGADWNSVLYRMVE